MVPQTLHPTWCCGIAITDTSRLLFRQNDVAVYIRRWIPICPQAVGVAQGQPHLRHGCSAIVGEVVLGRRCGSAAVDVDEPDAVDGELGDVLLTQRWPCLSVMRESGA